MTASVRVCARCHSEKPIEAFPIKDKARETRRAYCHPCCLEYGREHYARNKSAYKARTRSRHVRIRRDHRALVFDYLSSHPCIDCGISDPVVLEFDHRDPANKMTEVGHLIHSGSKFELDIEIEKCDVRCGNCHRRKTLLQFGSYRVAMLEAHA